MNTKIIAYYLPQYHEIIENDIWWGKGFTEWDHVRSARPLFEGHVQPRVPLNNNYYNLLNKTVVQWQTQLANEYGIYGFAYYHYWFDGRLLLEKPAENLLIWKDIPQKFFFFWANHTWYKAKNGKKEVLIEQQDGGLQDWINHYNYLRNFFQDERYIKVENMPVVGIYSPNLINDLDGMINTWNKLAIKDGYNGIYIIENKVKNRQEKRSKYSNAVVCRQPLVALNTYNLKLYKRILRKLLKLLRPVPEKPQVIDNMIISKLESEYIPSNKYKEYLGISTGWDNTPRHGNYGQVFINNTAEQFKRKLACIYNKSCELNNEFMFINAWNEWAEGMFLEPDEISNYSYLMAIKDVVKND